MGKEILITCMYQKPSKEETWIQGMSYHVSSAEEQCCNYDKP